VRIAFAKHLDILLQTYYQNIYMTKPLLRGVLKTWKEDRGFGFITPDNGGRDVFIHISAIGSQVSRRPEPGDIIQYQIVRDKHGKFRAINASIENSKTGHKDFNVAQNKLSFVWLTAIAVGVLIVIAGAAYFYFRSEGVSENLF
jgi:cold shock protein